MTSKILLLYSGANSTGKDIVSNIAKLFEESETIDLLSYEVEQTKLESVVAVIAIGNRASARIKDNNRIKRKLILPSLDKLEPKPENEKIRTDTWEAIQILVKEYKEQIEINKELITEDSIPILTSNQVLLLEKTLKANNKNTWIGKSKDGRSFRLTIEDTKEGNEDIRMTFRELFAIRAAMETLQVEEIQIVQSNSKNSYKGNNNLSNSKDIRNS